MTEGDVMGSTQTEPDVPEKSVLNDPWIHRSSSMRCRTCMWFVKKESVRKTVLGRCRRHAPVMNGFPVVFLDDWCGDHRLDEDKV